MHRQFAIFLHKIIKMALSDTSISISIELQNGTIILDLSPLKGTPLKVPTKLRESNIASFYTFFHNYLSIFQKKMKSISLKNYNSIYTVMNFLHEMGCQLNFQLFGEGYRRHVENFFIHNIPEWESSGLHHKIPKIIEIKTTDERLLLPIEYIPFFNTNHDFNQINNEDDLRKIACRFPSFSCIVKRVLIGHNKTFQAFSDAEIKNLDGLRVRHFCHAELKGSDQEKKFFESKEGIAYLGNWPDSVLTQDTFIDSFSNIIWTGYDKKNQNQEIDHIQHFSCHCNTKKQNHTDYEIILATKEKTFWGQNIVERKVSLGDLEKKFGRMYSRDRKKSYPLIFLNACGSSTFNPGNTNSFPNLFIEINNRGFIGTTANIPDNFAAEFSKKFYQYLLSGKSLGESIYLSKWNFLLVNSSPLGILYLIYANPDTKLTNPLLNNSTVL